MPGTRSSTGTRSGLDTGRVGAYCLPGRACGPRGAAPLNFRRQTGVLLRVMLPHEPGQTRGLASEDRLHRALALLLGALAGAVLLMREPAAPAEATGADAAARPREPDAPSRAALEAAIAELGRWFAARVPRAPLDANRRLLALGRSWL